MRKLIVILLLFFSFGGFCQSQYTNWFTVLSDSTPFSRALPANTLVHLLDSNKLYQLTAPRTVNSYMAQVFAAGTYKEVPGGFSSLQVDTLYITDSIYDLRIEGDYFYFNDTIYGIMNIQDSLTGYVQWADTTTKIGTRYNSDTLSLSVYDSLSNIYTETQVDNLLSAKQNVSDTSVKDATRYWVGLQAYLTAESDPVWISDSTDYLHKSDTNTKVASRKWVTDQGYSITTGTVTSISQGTGMLNSVNPITATGTVGVDTTKVVLFNDTLPGQKIATKYELGDQVFTNKFSLSVSDVANLGSLICIQFPDKPDSGYVQVLSAQIALYAIAKLDVGSQTLDLKYQSGDNVVVWTEAQIESAAGAHILSGAIQDNYSILETQWLGLQLSGTSNPSGVPNATMDLYVTFRYIDMSETGRDVGCP